LGLDPEEVLIHQRRLQEVLDGRREVTLKILDTCRFENHGILPSEWLPSQWSPSVEGFVAFIPAAGASSRYYGPLDTLRYLLKSADRSGLVEALRELHKQGADEWSLPASLASLVADPKKALLLTPEECKALIYETEVPKALLPCTKDGMTFYEMKLKEHQSLTGINHQAFVVPTGQTEIFNKIPGNNGLDISFLEQGPSLSTVRFTSSGQPWRDPDTGGASLVPAGHGTLVRLFRSCGKMSGSCHSLFIRNIDNVMGTSEPVVKATENFLSGHQWLLAQVKVIRKALLDDCIEECHKVCIDLLHALGGRSMSQESKSFIESQPKETQPLWMVQIDGFQMDCALIHNIAEIKGISLDESMLAWLFNRPVNTLGQVPNSGDDVGGTPAWVETPMGKVKVCLEVPHASQQDFDTFLADPKKATHFNPVFVGAEIPNSDDAYDHGSSPFWLMAKKKYQGDNVYYHETILYELLGNNLEANAIFVEVPRLVFNPHKVLADSAGRNNTHWLS